MVDVLVINSGSSSIKFAVFDAAGVNLLSGAATEIGGASRLTIAGEAEQPGLPDHASALSAILSGIAQHGIAVSSLAVAGHRVVHGGPRLTAPMLIDAYVEAEIEESIALAPLHNAPALHCIRSLRDLVPGLPQVAVFDTAFHASNPEVARRYAIPAELDRQGLRRYGFHGISYASLVEALGPGFPDRVLAFHLGNGSSICAIRGGRSVATTMGYSPLDGLTMGTRCGAIDPAVVLRLAGDVGADRAGRILNTESGLLALGGASNMQTLLARDDEAARFAVEHFCYWAARHSGSMVVAMGGVDLIAFTGGIGENAPEIRARILSHLACFGDPPVRIVPAREELQIARESFRAIGAAH